MIYWDSLFKKKVKRDKKEVSGLVGFVGAQGCGKTLSAVHFCQQTHIRRPEIKVYTNVPFKFYDGTLPTVYKSEDVSLIISDPNLHDAIIVVDEIAELFLNNTVSKVTLAAFAGITQVRKRHIVVLATMQNFADLATHLRRHFRIVVECRSFLKSKIQICIYYLRESMHFDVEKDKYVGEHVDFEVFGRTVQLCESYDTTYLIDAFMKARPKNLSPFVEPATDGLKVGATG